MAAPAAAAAPPTAAPPPPGGPVLSFEAVSAGYGPLVVLDGASLALAADEVLLVLGANGSGKSTLLKTAMGLTRVSAGRVAVAGRDVTNAPPHRRAALGLGYVPQSGNVFSDLTVRDNLKMGAFLYPDRVEAALPGLVDLFPRLGERLSARAGVLSGGERRMLSIAMTLLIEPKVLLLDEPSSDLAPSTVGLVYEAIGRVHRERAIPVLLVEQNIAKGLSAADRVLVMVRGRVAAEMPVGEVEPGRLHDLFMDGGVRVAG